MRITLTNVSGFDVQLKKFAKRIGADVGKVRDKAGLELYSRIVQKTPRLTGRLAASWNWSYHGIDLSVKPKGKYSKQTSPGVALDLNPFSILYITNSLPYAARIEFTGWSHTKAPQGMVRVSIEEVRASIASVL